MKKKIMLISLLFLCVTGCTSLNDASYEKIINEAATGSSITNTVRSGYKYYIPKGLRLLKDSGSNEILSDGKSIYYLYIDYFSYYNKIKNDYQKKTNVYYSEKIENEDKFGYVEIKKTENDQYFIEIMYNYAKIEVIVDENALSESIAYAMTLLSSIQYQDTVLKSLMGEDVLSSNEVEHNIFETAQTESGYLEIVEEYGTYEEEEEPVDPDFIRR